MNIIYIHIELVESVVDTVQEYMIQDVYRPITHV